MKKYAKTRASSTRFGARRRMLRRVVLLGTVMCLLLMMAAVLMGAKKEGNPPQKADPIFVTVNGQPAIYWNKPGGKSSSPQTASGKGGIGGPQMVYPQPTHVWTAQTIPTPGVHLRDIDLYGAHRGVVVGANGTILRTIDGETWVLETPPRIDDFFGVSTPEPDFNTLVGANGTIMFYERPDYQWVEHVSGITANLLDIVYGIRPPGIAFKLAVGENGTILKNSYNSPDWFPITTTGTTETLRGVFSDTWNFFHLAVGDNGTIVRSLEEDPTAFHLLNSGVTATLEDVHIFVNNTIAMAVGHGGLILRTEDKGDTWYVLNSGTTENLNSVYMWDDNHAMVVGDNGTILRTVNRGYSWTPETSNTTENLHSVHMWHISEGYAVGENGTMLHTEGHELPNLIVDAFTGPLSAEQGDDIAGDITLIVRNNGQADLWGIRVALSYIDALGGRTEYPYLFHEGFLNSGGSVQIPVSELILPMTAEPGVGQLEAVLDPWGELNETYEDDNTATASIILNEAEKVYVYYEDFQEGDGGWTPVDLLYQGIYWHQTVHNDGVQDRGVMWCGHDDPLWATPPGYGNDWDQRLEKEFTLPPSPVTIDYMIQYDTETGYDSLFLDISTDGGANYINLWAIDGSSGGYIPRQSDLSVYANQTVILRWRFTSDGAYDDEDGKYPTDGACRIDWIQVTGHPMDDFETDNSGWTAFTPHVTPGAYRLTEVPPCPEINPCEEACFAWEATNQDGVFPFAYNFDNPSERADISIGIESPVINIPTDGMAYQLEVDVLRDLPIPNLVFYTFQVAAPAPEYGGTWEHSPFVYYGNDTLIGGFHRSIFDITEFMSPGASTMKIRIYGTDMAYVWLGIYGPGEPHTQSPIFDNVAVVAIKTSAAGIDTTLYPRPCPGAPPPDTDNDGVLDVADVCPLDSSSPFDSDGDGCIDDGAGGRHVEYWERPAFPLTYYIHEAGAPDITDGSDFTAIQDAMNAWTGLPGLETAVIYGGTTSQADADAMDMINLVTFSDKEFKFGPGTLAVGLTTSFTEPTEIDGIIYRPGQVLDSDIIFNRGKNFRTASDGPLLGTYIEAVCTHEAGHVFGISHSAVRTSTMFFVLGRGLESASLETEDELAILKAYGDDAYMSSASRLSGTVRDGLTNDPVAGAAVFAISVTSHDTLANEFTLPGDGSYSFVGLPDGDYYLAIHPLNGSTAIGQLRPGYINELMDSTAQTVFTPEYWNVGESKNDDPAVMDAVTVTAGGSGVVADFITNVDETGPVVTHTVPDSNITDASIGGSVLISLSEAVSTNTLQGNFSLTNAATGEFVAGNAAFLNDDSMIAFVPSVGMEFSTQYKLRIGTGLKDNFNNGLEEPFVMYFTTEVMPDVALTSLAPSKGVPGTIVSMNGIGFDPHPSNNIVNFDGVNAVVRSATVTQLVVTVPEGVTSGVVNVYNQVEGQLSNDLSFTVLSNDEIPKGFESGVTDLTVTPKALTVLPDGSYAYMATEEGVKAVVVDPSRPDYLSTESIFVSGGLTDIDAAPAGNRVYAVSRITQKLYRINTTEGMIGILSEKDIGAEPRGIYIEPSGRRAFIPTYDGEIQMWDINEASPSFDSQIGRIESPDPNIRGKLAADPAGDKLLAPTGTGKLLVFDLGPDTLCASIRVGPDPRDVVVDPAGDHAYVCDENGIVSIISLEESVRLQDIKTGGTLRAVTVTPAGLFVHTVNRELNLLEAIDLREDASTFRSVAATIPLPVNPVDIELSPDGVYAYTISEAEQRLVVTTVGLGPSLTLSSRRAGPVGTGLVLAGKEYSAYSVSQVLFGEASAAPAWVSDHTLFVTVPADATSGPVRVVGMAPDGGTASSNALFFNVMGATEVDALRLAASLPSSPSPGTIDGGAVMASSPLGSFLVVGDRSGGIHLIDTDPASKRYHTYIGSSVLGEEANDIVMTPDGGYALVVLPGSKTVRVLNVNPLSQAFMTVVATADFSTFAGAELANVAVSPDRGQLLVSDPGLAQVHVLTLTGEEGHDLTGEEGHDLTVDASVTLAGGDLNGIVREMAYHPSGRYAFLPVHDDNPASILVLSTDPGSASYLSVVGTAALSGTVPQEIPIALSFTPDGSRALVLTTQAVATPNRSVVMLDCTDPVAPVVATALTLGGTSPAAAEHIVMSPRGDRAVANIQGVGLFNLYVGTGNDSLGLIQQTGDPAQHQTVADIVYAPDASKFYCLSESSDDLLVYDFSTVESIAIHSGDGQAGVIDDPMPMPLQVKVSGSSGEPGAGVPVTFEVTTGSGYFAETNTTTQVVETNNDGIASVELVLGSEIGAGAHTVSATAPGLTGSPLLFTAEGLADPTTLPLSVTYVVPVDGSENVSIPTAIQITFSRSVDPASIDDSTFFIHEGDQVAVSSTVGFADENRKVSLSPRVVLKPNTTYYIEVTDGITDANGGALSQAVTSVFITQGPPPVVLESIAPVSAPEGAMVVISGSGFSSDLEFNEVLFNELAASVRSGGKDYLNAVVPHGAQSGFVLVVNTESADTSNALEFKVLHREDRSANEVVATIGTSSATRSVAITPDGAMAYAVGPYKNVVIPFNYRLIKVLPDIPVGENPVAVAINPDGQYAYIANYVEGTVSIIDVVPSSPDYNRVVDAMAVGVAPSDLAITPDGDRLIVVNSGSSNLSVVDTDLKSATHHSVIASIGTGTGSRTVSITPDGGLIYLGTDTGYLVLSASSYGVIASIGTGSATRSVSITPDGAFLILLTTEGVVNIFDIQPNSASHDQVIATIGTGSSTRTVGISPDGGLLYLIQEDEDIIILVSLTVGTSMGVREDEYTLPASTLEYEFVDTLVAGEDPACIAFDPTGSGSFIVTNSGDNTITVFGELAALAGYVRADCPQYGTGLYGVKVDAFEQGTGNLTQTMVTNENGYYFNKLREGSYTIIPVLPLGYTAATEESLTTCTAGDTVQIDFDLMCEQVVPNTRKMSYWKHQLALVIDGEGHPDIDAETFCGYLDLIESHFNSNRINPVVVYQPPASGECVDKLLEAKALLNLLGDQGEIAHAKKQLMALLFNVASQKLRLNHIVSADGATVSKAITFVDNMIDAGNMHDAKIARKVARDINHGKLIEAGIIPSDLPDIIYVDRLLRLSLAQNYPNPFNPSTTIEYEIPRKVHVRLAIYNVAGQLVRVLVDKEQWAAHYAVEWNGRDNNDQPVASGVYFYRFQAGERVMTRKMVLLK